MAVVVSGSAILILFVIVTALCISLALFSLRKVPGDMVSGGTNSLVLSAACHVPAILRRNRSQSARQSRLANRSNITERSKNADVSLASGYQRVTSFQGAEVGSEGLQPLYESYVSPEAETPSTFGQQDEVGEDELQLLSSAVEGDDELALLEKVAMSKVRWGAIPADPDILEGLDTDEVVLHLGFGTEEHRVEPPCEGRLYI